MNLALNARDAMPKGGQLQIGLARIRVADDGRGPLPEMDAGEWVQLTVTDNGTGISPDLLPRIFDPFVTTKPPGHGSGLGLAQVHGIVKLHEGEIDVASQVGRGTTFTLYFPTPDTPTPDTLEDEMQDLIYGQGETILVVEDETATREALIDSLELLGYRPLAATNGREALDLLTSRTEKVALLLSDVVMPEMGGIELLQALQAQGIQPKTLLLSGHPMQNELENLCEKGMIDWLAKPPTLDSLARAVAEALAA
jgi:CheY-like chemotaxis protein